MIHHLKIFWRSLGRNRVHSIITIGGFALSMAVVLILTAYIQSEKRYNRHYPNIDRMYLVVREDNSAFIPEKLYDSLSNNLPEVEQVTMWDRREARIKAQGSTVKGNIIATDEGFLDVFSVKVLRGRSEISIKENILLTHDYATKLFGAKDPVGCSVTLFNREWTITGIIESPSEYSGIQYDALLPRQGYEYGTYSRDGHLVQCAIRMAEHAAPEMLKTHIGKFTSLGDGLTGDGSNQRKKLEILPFKDSYFDASIKGDGLLHANIALIRLLIYVTIVILFLAVLNYINLTTVRGLKRFREVGIRKTIGANRRTILSQIITETYLIFVLSTILAVAATVPGIPLFEQFLGKQVSLTPLISELSVLVQLAGILIVCGFISGVIPALSASKYSPVQLLKKELITSKLYGIRRIMNIAQFAIAITLIMALMHIMRQVDYVNNTDLGFDEEQLLRVDVQGMSGVKKRALADQLLENPMIVRASLSGGGPGEVMIADVNFAAYIDTGFLETFGIRLLKGRNLTPQDAVSSEEYPNGLYGMINETLYKKLGGGPLKDLKVDLFKEVVGVTGDFHFADLHQSVGGLMMNCLYDPVLANALNLRIRPENTSQTVDFIRKTFLSFQPDESFSYRFYDEWFSSMYAQEEKQMAAIRIFAVLAIVISCMGLFGLAEFQARRKIKEIGIRKVNGASISQVLWLLNKDFLTWVGIAFVIATPIAWYAMTLPLILIRPGRRMD